MVHIWVDFCGSGLLWEYKKVINGTVFRTTHHKAWKSRSVQLLWASVFQLSQNSSVEAIWKINELAKTLTNQNSKNKPLRSENQLLLNCSDKMKLKLITVNCAILLTVLSINISRRWTIYCERFIATVLWT